jgi:uncharacterized protein (TIGR03435 family)
MVLRLDCRGIAGLLAAAWLVVAAPAAFGEIAAGQGFAVSQVVVGDSASPGFDVISIRPANPGGQARFLTTADGFIATNLPLLNLFRFAYVPTGAGDSGFFRTDRMLGVPDWLAKEKYDVVAKVSEADLAEWQKPARQQEMLRAMLQRLLEERCKVKVHCENKDMPIYALRVTKNGPKFKAAETTDITDLRAKHPGAMMMPGGATMARGVEPGEQDWYSTSMAALALQLTTPVRRQVVDETGLTGKYDFKLQVAPVGTLMARDETRTDADAPSIFTAVQEQLGLKLESATGAVQMLVIDQVERPSEN